MITMPKRWGMFVHWGPYSMSGWHEQIRMRQGIDRKAYAAMAAGFRPDKYNPKDWVRLAKEAGMEYICFTTKHHDGFCMWDTKETDFNIMKTWGQDVLYQLSEACSRENMGLSLYYSIPDWHRFDGYNALSSHQCPLEIGDIPDSESYRAYVKAQVKELLTGYGKIYTWFWDIPPKIEDPSLNELVRSLQPEVLINDRGYSAGDFSTPERSVPDGEYFTRYTEACQSVGQYSWGWREQEDYFTPAFLTQSMDRILMMGGSYLLNVGPTAQGEIPECSAGILRSCGEWYGKVKEAFTPDAEPCQDFISSAFYAARTGNTWYLHCNRPLISTGLSLAPFDRLPKSAVVLNTGREVEAVVETYPDDFTGVYGNNRPAVLHLRGLEPDMLGMPLVIRVQF